VTEPVVIGPLTLDFTRIADPDRVLDAVAAEEDRLEKLRGRVPEDQLHLPYWAELWDSALGMGTFLTSLQSDEGLAETRPWSFPSSLRRFVASSLSTLDLGCGMGLSGTAAAALGHSVLFADLEAPALLFARLNSLPYADRVRFRRLDWRRDQLDERFDLILGADILYERKQWDYLEPFWRAHLAPEGTILLGEPGRQTGDLFVDWIQSKGWSLTQHEQRVATRPRPIRLFELRGGIDD
jgi:predicted nicotinamide N-methyase